MPSRSRPTARLLTPAGWTGVLIAALLLVALVVGAAAFTGVGLPHA
jgi:hypothetical protein